jgi:endoglucanase
MKLNYGILKDITAINSPSGNEQAMVKYLKKLAPKNFKFKTTKKNSCYYEARPHEGANAVFIDAHIDTVHLKIISITKDKYVVALPVGFEGDIADGLVLVHMETGLRGAVVTLPPHLNLVRRTSSEVFIDFGLSKGELSELFEIGDYILFENNYSKIGKEGIIGRGLDDKCGVFVLISLLQYFDKANNYKKLKHNLILHFSSREETGLGSFAHVRKLKINEIITLDTIYSTDTELIPDYITSSIYYGLGPLITRNADDDLCLGNKLIDIAVKKKLKYQIGYSGSDNGGSNNAWYSKNIDANSQNLGIPLKHMHSPNTFDLLLHY